MLYAVNLLRGKNMYGGVGPQKHLIPDSRWTYRAVDEIQAIGIRDPDYFIASHGSAHVPPDVCCWNLEPRLVVKKYQRVMSSTVITSQGRMTHFISVIEGGA